MKTDHKITSVHPMRHLQTDGAIVDNNNSSEATRLVKQGHETDTLSLRDSYLEVWLDT